jgi:pyridoxine kinase
VGTGDVTSGLFLCRLLQGAPVKQALEHTASAYHAIMQATHDAGEYELQAVLAQDEIAAPSRWFEASRL